jgi:hypothetical protein
MTIAHLNLQLSVRRTSRQLKFVLPGVTVREAKDLLFVRAKNKADPSIAQNRRPFANPD